MRTSIAILLLALVAGCNKVEHQAASIPEKAATDAAGGMRTSADNAGVALYSVDSPAARKPNSERMMIRTATVAIVVSDTTSAINGITHAIEGEGGYVSDSNVWRDGELLRGTMTLRVPAARLAATLGAIRKLAVRVQNESLASQEVTEEYVDLEAQLRNLEATETELRQLMTLVRERSKKASEVLEMHQQLQAIRGQIEQTKGRMRYLSQMTSFASVQLNLTPDAIAQPVVAPGWQPLVVVKNASRALVEAMQVVANGAIWFAVYILPILLLAAGALSAIWKLLSRLARPRVTA